MATGGLIQMNKSMRCRQKEGTRQKLCVFKERWRRGQRNKEQTLDGDKTKQMHSNWSELNMVERFHLLCAANEPYHWSENLIFYGAMETGLKMLLIHRRVVAVV